MNFNLHLSSKNRVLSIEKITGELVDKIYIDQALYELITVILDLDYENGELLLYDALYPIAKKYVETSKKTFQEDEEQKKYVIFLFMDTIRKKIKIKGIPLVFVNERGIGYKIFMI